jgi:hypothetical protein
MGTGIEIDHLFLKKILIDPGALVEIFTKMSLFLAKKLVFRKKIVNSLRVSSRNLKILTKNQNCTHSKDFFFQGGTTSKLFDA